MRCPRNCCSRRSTRRCAATSRARSAAARAATGAELTLIAPAFPATGRTTAGGYQRVHGRTLGHLPSLLGARHAEAGEAVLAAGGAVVCDAATDADLAAIVRAGLSCGRRVLWVGSGGLAHALAETFPARPAPAAPRAAGPVLVVAGSPSPVARGQLAAVARAGVAVVDDPAALARELAAGRDAAVTRAELARPGIGGLVVTGGATARAVAATLGARRLRLLAEPEPGVVAGLLDDLPIVLKAGGFGSPRTLLDAMAFLHRA